MLMELSEVSDTDLIGTLPMCCIRRDINCVIGGSDSMGLVFELGTRIRCHKKFKKFFLLVIIFVTFQLTEGKLVASCVSCIKK